jgi:hypothetical protein
MQGMIQQQFGYAVQQQLVQAKEATAEELARTLFDLDAPASSDGLVEAGVRQQAGHAGQGLMLPAQGLKEGKDGAPGQVEALRDRLSKSIMLVRVAAFKCNMRR